ncbi:MAG: ribonuclease HII [Lachnospiraceae bacterium]|nr:ribonuclease HII [Lachnospiraceae bacterium]
MRKAAQIQEIYRKTDKTDEAALRSFIREYGDDPRAGIQKLVQGAGKALERIGQERERLEQMRSYERDCIQKGYTYICGIDEAGRGPLAGPVVAGAVILPQDCEIFGLNDSKKLSEKRREELYEEITEKALAWGAGVIGPARIDEINILQADYEAMCEAIGQLKVMPQILLNDAVTIPQVRIPQISIIHGDARSVSIAAASIIAKVTRDRMMVEYDSLFPEYGFAEHKGYGTAAHYTALKKYGPCMIHRKTFLKNLEEH